MAIVPLIVNLARELDHEDRSTDLEHLWDDDFGFGIHPVDIFRSRLNQSSLLPQLRRRYAPYDRYKRAANRIGKILGGDIESTALLPNVGKDGFQVCMDVSQFKPNELSVKTVDKTIVVEGKHEEREDDYGHGLIQRQFVRKYNLPKGYDPKEVISTISSDGVLTVKAPPPPNKAIKQNERVVQIQQTGPAHLSVKAPEQSQAEKDKTAETRNGAAERMETK